MSVLTKVSDSKKPACNTIAANCNTSAVKTSEQGNEASYFVSNELMEEHHTEILTEGEKLIEKSEIERFHELDVKMKYNKLMKFLNDMKNVEAESTREVNDGVLSNEEHLTLLNERNRFVKNSNGTLNYEYVENRIKEMDDTYKRLKKAKNPSLPKINKSKQGPIPAKPKKQTSFVLPSLERSYQALVRQKLIQKCQCNLHLALVMTFQCIKIRKFNKTNANLMQILSYSYELHAL